MARNSNNKAEWLHPPAEEEGLRRYVETIRERFGLVILAVLITTGAAVAYVITAPKTYEACHRHARHPRLRRGPTLTALPLIRESVDPDPRRRDRCAAGSRTSTWPSGSRRTSEARTKREALLDKVDRGADRAEQLRLGHGDRGLSRGGGGAGERVRDGHRRGPDRPAPPGRGPAARGPRPGGPERDRDAEPPDLLANAPTPDIRIETAAQPPSSQASPRPALSIAAGLVAGLVLGVAGAFASQILDPRLRREAQLRRLYRLPDPRPHSRRGRQAPGASPLGPRGSPRREPRPTGRCARRSRPRPTAGDGRVILVTGPSPGEGKSTTAVNLASSLALAGKQGDPDRGGPAPARSAGPGDGGLSGPRRRSQRSDRERRASRTR